MTTGFVGDRGAKGYVVSIADLHDLQVELDISQNDFANLGQTQTAVVRMEAYPDRKYQGVIAEISPEANRQKATIQVKVKILEPDEFLRPDMSANVGFVASTSSDGSEKKPTIEVPTAAVNEDAVFVVVEGRAIRRLVKDLIGGEDVIVAPPKTIEDGTKVKIKEKQ